MKINSGIRRTVAVTTAALALSITAGLSPANAAVTGDNFDRADSATLGPGWTPALAQGFDAPQITGNRFGSGPDGGSSVALRDGATATSIAATIYANELPTQSPGSNIGVVALAYSSLADLLIGGLYGTGPTDPFIVMAISNDAEGHQIACVAPLTTPVTSARVTLSIVPSQNTVGAFHATLTYDSDFDGSPEQSLDCETQVHLGTQVGLGVNGPATADDFGDISTSQPPVDTSNHEPPVLTIAARTIEANTTGGYTGPIDGVSAIDGDRLGGPVRLANDKPAFLPLGVNYIHHVATDEDGNHAEGWQTVNVVDTTKPALTCPADVTEAAGPSAGLGTPSISDIADAHPTLTNNAPAAFTNDVTPVTWTGKDHSGNLATCTQRVTLAAQLLTLSIADTGKVRKPVALTGLVKPKGSLTTIQLQRLVNGKWVNANVLKVNADGSIATKLSFKSKGTYTMRLIRPASGGRAEQVSNAETFVIS